MGKLCLILGGARSGKSTYAQRLAGERGQAVVYLATARSLDDEMQKRIRIHRSDRPLEWITLEVERQVGPAVLNRCPQAEVVLLDCLTMLVTNLLMDVSADEDHPDEEAAEAALEDELRSLLEALHRGRSNWIIVSNEVGLGLVPPYPLGRLYRDLLGRANQRLACVADEVFWMVAGIPVPIHDYRLP